MLASFAYYCTACGFYIHEEVEKNVFTACGEDVFKSTIPYPVSKHAWKSVTSAVKELIEIEKSLR